MENLRRDVAQLGPAERVQLEELANARRAAAIERTERAAPAGSVSMQDFQRRRAELGKLSAITTRLESVMDVASQYGNERSPARAAEVESER